MSERTIRAAVVGASGYTGAELLRILLGHPHAELVAVTSRQYAGQRLGEVFPRFRGLPGSALEFVEPTTAALVAAGAEVAFLALPHGVAVDYAPGLLDAGIRVIDLSADFRLRDPALYAEFYGAAHPAPELLAEAVYGFPEVRAEEIRAARLIAAPGCYPTSISLPLIPLLRAGLLDPCSIVTCSMSGVSGAGKKAEPTLMFCECQESLRAYGVPKHRHLAEIEQELGIAAGRPVTISFTPHLVPVLSGICTTSSALLAPGATPEQIGAALQQAYGAAPFVRLLGMGGCPDTKHVTRTNFLDIGWNFDPRTGRVLLLSAEDNLGKGAGGQAIQCLNLAFDLPETAGLLRA
jgi:N-acetyl-gamma-glutamyl-phosphate reductase